MNSILLLAGLLALVVLLFWEWRRSHRRHLVYRLAATVLAVLSLAFLFHAATGPETSSSGAEAALWTSGGVSAIGNLQPPLQFALPDSTGPLPPLTRFVPDVGTLRRRFPALRTLQIFGDGVDPAEVPALTGLQVAFHPPDRLSATPALLFLSAPRELPLGQPLVVAGRVGGLPPGTNLPVSLESPDGTKTEAPTSPADSHGDASFTLRAAPLSAAGRYLWQLRVGQTTGPLGVSVVPPMLPRVLVLEGEPHFDTAALRRWYEGAGGTLTVRTQVGKSNTQFATAQGKISAFAAVDAPFLSDFDLVLADGTALTNLHPEERAALTGAIEKIGLGLLVRADAAVLPPDAPAIPPDLLPFFPWKLTPVGEAPPGDERPVRPQWPGQSAASEIPVSAAPFAIQLGDRQDLLVSDREDHTLAAASQQGPGQIALTLVRATTRWQRENDHGSFAAYWSYLFTRLSRHDNLTGRWSLVGGDSSPVFVDHPLQLRWSGPSAGSPTPGTVTTADSPATTLPLAQDERQPNAWSGTFWPRRAGWHQVTATAGGQPLDFYVHPAEAWPGLQAARRRLATERFAVESSAPSVATVPPLPCNHRLNPAWWFLLFVLATGYLWTERRFAVA